MTEFRKISITVPADLLDQVRERVGPRGLSAYVTEVLERHERRVAMRAYLDAVQAEHGAFPAELVEEARRWWDEPVEVRAAQ